MAGGGGTSCLPDCEDCGGACTACINGGGGMACASKCCDSAALVAPLFLGGEDGWVAPVQALEQ